VTGAVQAAAIRRRVRIPLWLADDYSTSAAQMLHALGAKRIALLSNNPDKGAQLARMGISIARQVATALHLNGTNAAYLATKAARGGHDLLSRSLERVPER
jgi:hypothetical protein